MKTSLVFLCGGAGSRCSSQQPKQYISIHQRPLFSYSLEKLLSSADFEEVALVCDPQKQEAFLPWLPEGISYVFATPGKRRQDSVYSGIKALEKKTSRVMVHDAARPLIRERSIRQLLEASCKYVAVALGVGIAFTVRQVNEKGKVEKTLNRESLREIQTPQVVHYSLLKEGLELAQDQGITVTDDVEAAQLLGHLIHLVEGNNVNLKVTQHQDLAIVEALLLQDA